jgi:hypothetical protein
MTAFNEALNSPFLAATTEQNETAPVLAARDLRRGSLPNPKGTSAKVADSGRIRFGAGYRLPASK